MEDKEAVGVLRELLLTGKLDDREVEAVRVAVGAMSLMVKTSEGYLKQLKAKKDRQSAE